MRLDCWTTTTQSTASKDSLLVKCTTSTAPSSPLAVYWTAEVASSEKEAEAARRSGSSNPFEVERFGGCHSSSHSFSTEASSQWCGDISSVYKSGESVRAWSREAMGLASNSGGVPFRVGSSVSETALVGGMENERPSESTGYAAQESLHGYQTGLMYQTERKAGLVGSSGSHKRARPEGSGGLSMFNIAPRASKKSRRRTTSGRGVMWPSSALRQILPSMKPEAVINCLVGACERNPMAMEYVKSQMAQDPHCRRVCVRNVPYGTQAGFLAHTIEEAFGEVERVALLTNKGMGAVVFRAFESAFRAAMGMSSGPVAAASSSGPIAAASSGPVAGAASSSGPVAGAASSSGPVAGAASSGPVAGAASPAATCSVPVAAAATDSVAPAVTGSVAPAATSSVATCSVPVEAWSIPAAAAGGGSSSSSVPVGIPVGASSVVTLGGRVLQFRFLASNDKFWDLLESGPSGGLAVWPSSNEGVGGRRRRVMAAGPNRRKRHFYQVVVRDLAPGTDEQTLASAFAHFGDIKRIFVPVDAVTGVAKNHGYITFNHDEDALRAVQQTQRMIDNRLTFVTLSTASRRRRSQSIPTGYYNHRGRRSRSSKQKQMEEN